MPRLTKTVVEGLRATASDIIVWDSGMPRFGVRVYPTSRRHPHGKKVDLIQHRTREGRSGGGQGR